jgi:hypothetical protein
MYKPKFCLQCGRALSRARLNLRPIAVLSSVALVGLFAASCGLTASAPSEAETTAQKLWDKIVKKCGDDYFYAGSTLDPSDVLLEFKDVAFNVVPKEVSKASQLNGLEWEGHEQQHKILRAVLLENQGVPRTGEAKSLLPAGRITGVTRRANRSPLSCAANGNGSSVSTASRQP